MKRLWRERRNAPSFSGFHFSLCITYPCLFQSSFGPLFLSLRFAFKPWVNAFVFFPPLFHLFIPGRQFKKKNSLKEENTTTKELSQMRLERRLSQKNVFLLFLGPDSCFLVIFVYIFYSGQIIVFGNTPCKSSYYYLLEVLMQSICLLPSTYTASGNTSPPTVSPSAWSTAECSVCGEPLNCSLHI